MRKMLRWRGVAVCAGLMGLSQMSAEESNARGIVPEVFVKARPGKATAGAAPQAKYQRVGAASSEKANRQAASGEVRQLGLTIWRLRPSTSADSGARILVHDAGGTIEWTPERVSTGSVLRVGDRVRLSVESAQTGYLYVVDQERYADGSLGEPQLIFPTTRTRNGDNQVTAGKLIEIPGQEDQPNYFTMKRSRPDQMGEELTFVVTPQPLEGITLTADPAVLARGDVAKWEAQWGRKFERLELAGGAGRAWTKAEQEAGAGGTRLLTQEEPGPQTIYRVSAGPADPLLVKLGLRYGASKTAR